MNFFRNPPAVPAFSQLQPNHRACLHQNGLRPQRGFDWLLFVPLVRNYIMPPAESRAHGDHNTRCTHRPVRHDPGKQQDHAECEHHWPERRCGHLDMRLLAMFARFSVMRFVRHYLPTTYTTVKTTTHTASTKCQYQDKNRTRRNCV